MTARVIHLKKEARHLAWPFTAVTLLGLVSLLSHSTQMSWGPFDFRHALELGAFGGIPLLAAMVLGNEFQYHTLGLLLAQPVERRDIWFQKFVVTMTAVIPPATLFCASAFLSKDMPREEFLFAVAWITMTAGSAFFWTLTARSTLGGFALSVGSSGLAFMVAGFALEYLRRRGGIPASLLTSGAVTSIAYAVTMIWLGRRAFLSFQAIEGAHSVEMILPGLGFFPKALVAWCRPYPSTPVLNLVTREFRLLRTLWPLSLVSVTAWIALIASHALPLSDARPLILPFFAVTVMLSILIALLAGALSLGEEKQWGTHEWHLTLPISFTKLWVVKLSVAIMLSVVCGALLPLSVLIIAGLRAGNVHAFVPNDVVWLWPLQMATVTFVAFWCACVVKGTVKAALLTFPVCLVIMAAGFVGSGMGDMAATYSQKPFGWITSFWGPVKMGTLLHTFNWLFFSPTTVLGSVAVLIGLSAIQSRRLFREPDIDRKLRVVRVLRPLVLLTLFATFGFAFLFDLNLYLFQRGSAMAKELNAAIQTLNLNASMDGNPVRLRFDDLAQSSLLSGDTKRWLAGSTILVVPRQPRNSWGWGSFGHFQDIKGSHPWPYTSTLRLADGSTCSFSLWVSKATAVASGTCN